MAETIISGEVNNIIYYSAESGYCVFSLEVIDDDGDKAEITCTATAPHLTEGEQITASGRFVEHSVYGSQFRVYFFEKAAPTSTESIVKYLMSGIITGIGENLARRIVNKFDIDTLDIIENYPEKLAQIKGISLKKANEVSEIVKEQVHLRSAMFFLQKYDVSAVYAVKIYEKYKENTIETVKKNPYTLADDIHGIGFKKADEIAQKMGIDNNSIFRINSGIRFCLFQATLNGHVYLPKEQLLMEARDLLFVDPAQIDVVLTEMFINKQIVQEKINGVTAVYLIGYHHAENFVANKLLEISAFTIDKSRHIESEITKTEQELDIKLAKKQREAISESLSKGVLVITGGPGTGKTTAINAIIQMLLKNGMKVELAAPTGRAAKKMTETTGERARTIHRLLGLGFIGDEPKTSDNEENRKERMIDADVVIIDESSMVDILLMSTLLKAIDTGTRLILVGDMDQLPSVGPGNVLRDIIQSNVICVVRLDEIFRQAQKSAIVMNAHRINKGAYPKLNEKDSDFYFVKRFGQPETLNTLVDLIMNRLPEFGDFDPFKDMQVLTPMRKSLLGVMNLNKVLQDALNPPSPKKKEFEFRSTLFREGDKIMQIRNNYDLEWQIKDQRGRKIGDGKGVFNGDEGVIQKLNLENNEVHVLFDDGKSAEYALSQLDELDLSYAVTIHKSQGSEYRVILMPVQTGPEMLMTRNLLYTAVTRAKELAVLVGVPEYLNKMVDNNRELSRYSSLNHRIIKLSQYFYNNDLFK